MATRRTEAEIQAIIDRCVEIERRNGDVLEYLRSKNYISPGGTWYNFQRERLGRKAKDITSGKPVKRREERNMGKKEIKEKAKYFCTMIQEGKTKDEALAAIGCTNARTKGQAFRYIKAYLQETDPLAYDAMMETIESGTRKEPEKSVVYDDGPAENAMMEDALVLSGRREMFEAGCMEDENEHEPARIEPDRKPKLFKITQIVSKLAEYNFNDADCQNLLTVEVWTGTGDEEEMELTVDQWKTLIEELPEVIRKFTEGA